MKKRIGYLGMFLAFLLIGCTFLSRRVEETMMTQAVVKHYEGSSITFPAKVLFDSVLYEAEEGLGWNTGLRASEVPPTSYTHTDSGDLMMDYASLDVIYTASRVPAPGERVNRLLTDKKGNRETAQDRYLVIYCNGAPEGHDIPDGLSLVKRNDNVMLLDAAESPLPFIEHEAKGLFNMIWGMEWRIFSMSDLEQLVSSLPLIALAAVLAAIPLVLFLLGICLPPLQAGKDLVLRLQMGVGISCLAGFIGLFYAIHLPSSLMPVDMIFQWDHYTGHLQTALYALEQLEEPSLAVLLTHSRSAAFWVLAAGAVMLAASVALSLYLRKSKKLRD